MDSVGGLSSYITSDYWKSTTQTRDLEKTLSNAEEAEMTEDELMDVCKDFETYFVEQMFKAMQKMVPENEDSDNKYMDMFGDMLVQEYAEKATEQQDFGIAKTLYEQMKRNYGLE